MLSLLRVPTILFIWILFAVFLIFGVVFAFNRIAIQKYKESPKPYNSKNVFETESAISLQDQFLATIQSQDAKSALVERFLKENNSPMVDSTATFIKAAEKYNLDWKLLPAIAFTESTLGKKTPFGTYNAFGWGIIDSTAKGTDFDSWDDAILSVAKGLREDYYNQGLTTLEAISGRYAGDENWDNKVLRAMDDITN